jgi:hypothetical protein
VQFSSKIAHSFIQYGSKNQLDTVRLLNQAGLSFELCNHGDAWIAAENLETFLKLVKEQASDQKDMSLIEKVGHQALDLKAWGVLDSVLKMIRSSKDIYQNPQRILSYFIFPAPPIKKINSSETSVRFEVPFFFEEYPHIFSYLKSCFEVISTFLGDPSAIVSWEGNVLQIDWSQKQGLLLDQEAYNLNPELIKNIIETIESSHSEIQALQAQLAQKKLELERYQEIQSLDQSQTCWTSHDKKWFEDQVSKLQDYFLRAQQMVTILAGSEKKSKFVKEAMKKVHWNNVPELFPETVDRLKRRLNSEDTTDLESSAPDQKFQLELQ